MCVVVSPVMRMDYVEKRFVGIHSLKRMKKNEQFRIGHFSQLHDSFIGSE